MKCYFDENLPPKLARAINILEGDRGVEVKHLRDEFTPGTTDIEWITEISNNSEKCLIITKDRHIRKNRPEMAAWKESGLQIIFMQKAWSSQKLWDINWKLVKRWPEIRVAVKNSDLSFELPINGRINAT